MRDGATHTSCFSVAFESQSVPRASFPGFEQCMGEQGQCSWFIAYIPQNQIHEARLECPMSMPGRFFNGTTQFLRCHRSDIFLLPCDCVAQFGVLCKMRVKICTQSEDDSNFTLTRVPIPSGREGRQ